MKGCFCGTVELIKPVSPLGPREEQGLRTQQRLGSDVCDIKPFVLQHTSSGGYLYSSTLTFLPCQMRKEFYREVQREQDFREFTRA